MDRQRVLVPLLLSIIALESAFLVFLYSQMRVGTPTVHYKAVNPQTFAIPFFQFNTPQSNDTEYNLTEKQTGSWMIVIQSRLNFTIPNRSTEAQIAIAPEYPEENVSIPTIIVQMRVDGLLRIEYYAQDWINTYGLVLYNSTSPTWLDSQNITLKFVSFGPPAEVNPQLAPRPNGNLTILVGPTTVLVDYPIAWANLASFYIYGLPNSKFTAGEVYVTVYELLPRPT